MPTFQYQSMKSSEAGPATIDAPDRAAAVRALMAKGITPTRVEPVGKPGGPRAGARARARSGAGLSLRIGNSPMTRSEMASFIGELATAVQGGAPDRAGAAHDRRTGANRRAEEDAGHDHSGRRARSVAGGLDARGRPAVHRARDESGPGGRGVGAARRGAGSGGGASGPGPEAASGVDLGDDVPGDPDDVHRDRDRDSGDVHRSRTS